MDAIISAISALPLEQQSEWREIHEASGDATRVLDWRTLPRWTPGHRDAVAVALHDVTLSRDDACGVLHAITCEDRRVGVWLACACARTALRYVPAGDDRPRLAIEAAERWVRSEATGIDCGAAAAAAYVAFSGAYDGYIAGATNSTAVANADAAACAAARAAHAAARDRSDDAAYAAEAAAANAAAAHNAAIAAACPADDARHAATAAARTAAYTRSLLDLCQTIALSAREALDAASDGYRASMPLEHGSRRA